MTMQRRADGSMYDSEQLRHKGKFIKQRVSVNAFDVLEMRKAGFSREESQRALDALNVQVYSRIRAGQSEKMIDAELRQVFDTSKGKFVDVEIV